MKTTALLFIHELTQKLLPEYTLEHLAQESAWQLLELATGLDQATLFAQKELQLTAEQQHKVDQWVAEIVQKHKPIQYIIGSVPFIDLTIKVRPPVLIPRPETEEWCEKVIESLAMSGVSSILDLCTGTGCIALALAKAFPQAQIYASDISDIALKLAQENAELNKITNITFIKSDLYTNIPDLQFDIIVANPPYIAPEEYKKLDPSVTQWEDKHALTAPDHGLEIIEKIIDDAKKFLKNDKKMAPQLWIEIDSNQGQAVSKICQKAALKATILKDLAGRDRVITASLI